MDVDKRKEQIEGLAQTKRRRPKPMTDVEKAVEEFVVWNCGGDVHGLAGEAEFTKRLLALVAKVRAETRAETLEEAAKACLDFDCAEAVRSLPDAEVPR